MFGFSQRELALWICGTLVGAVLVVCGAFYAIDNWLDPTDPDDLLTQRSALDQSQDVGNIRDRTSAVSRSSANTK